MTRHANVAAAVVLVALAALVVLPAIARARNAAATSRSKNNLRAVGQGIFAFEGAYGIFPGNGGPPPEAVTTPDCRTTYPTSESFRWGYGDPKRAGKMQTGSWAYSILPYVGEEEAFRKQDHSRAVPIYYIGTRRPAEPQNTPKIDPVYKGFSYQDAGIGPTGRTDYAANDQVCLNGAGRGGMKPASVKDGLAETLLAAEKAMDTRGVECGTWYWDGGIILGNTGGSGRKGNKLLRDADDLGEKINDNWGSPDPDGVWFLFCDGHARKLPYGTPPKVIAATITPSAGDVVHLD
jgi:hypothetical protein